VKNIRIAADLRLLLPVLVGWIVLARALVLIDTKQIAAPVGGGIVLLVILCGISVIRLLPILGLSVVIIAAMLASWLLQIPIHIETHPWDVPMPTRAPWWLAWADVLRSSFLSATAELPDYGGQLIPGLAIGDTSRVSEQLSNSMKVVSLTHVTAVSGANCAIVTASVMSIAALCGAGRKVRLIVASVTLVAFVVLVTPQPSVLRAAVMAMVVMFSLFSGRPGSGIPLLALATLSMLLWNPWWAIDFGFILSVSATAGIVLFSGPLTMSISRWLPFGLSAMIAIPLSAQIMCQPFIILLSPQLPTYGVLANVIAAPAAPVATVVGLVACLVAWCAPGLALPLLWMSWLPAQWIGHTAILISRFPQAQIPWFEGMMGALCAAMLSVLVLLALLAPKIIVRFTSAVVIVMLGAIWGVSALVTGFTFSSSLPNDWSIAACDVGQGDALVLKSKGQVAVIDVGRTPEPMKKCLEQLRITHIDLLVLTHFDKDHVGGLDAVMGKVDNAIVGKPENAEDQGLLTELSRAGALLQRGVQGLSGALGEAQWQVLWPDTVHPTMEQGNPGSVTLLVAFPSFRALFLGDLGQEAQLALINTVDLPSVQVVKVAHHGSADQSSTLYEKVHPLIGLFSVGAGNDYGHPRSETLSLLTDLGSLTPRTDEDGLILISASASGLSVWTEH
jgi:competence protein ComEC